MGKREAEIKITGNTDDAQASIKDMEIEARKSFNKMSEDAKKESDEVSDAFKKSGLRMEKDIRKSSAEAIKRYRKIKKSGTASANDIKRAHNSMTAKIKKNNAELSISEDKLIKKTNLLSKAFGSIKGRIIAAGIAAAGFFGVKTLSESIKFESALLDLQKVMTDAEGDAKQFTGVTEELAKKFAVSSAEVLQGAANFKQAGFSLEESFLLQEQALKLVIAGDIEAAQASELLISTLKGFKAPASEAARLTDVLNEVSNRYATNLNELAIAMADVSPIAKLMGFSFEETAGLLTPIIEVFRSGSESAQGFRTGLLKLIDDAVPVREALHGLGVDQKEANGAMRSGKDIVADVATAFIGLEENQKLVFATQLVGIRQAAKMVEVFNGLSKSTEITNVAMGAAGSINKEVNIRLASTAIKGKKAAQSFAIMAKNIGNLLLPVWNKLLDVAIVTFDVLAKGFSATKNFIDSLPDFTRFVIPFLGLIKSSKKVEDQTKALTKANEEFEESEKKVKEQLENSAAAFEERRKTRQDDAAQASDLAQKELESINVSIAAQERKNKLIKQNINDVKSSLRDLEKELTAAASFTEKVLAAIAKSEKVREQAAFDPLEKLVDNLDRAKSDFRQAVKAGADVNTEEAREITLAAVEAANAILEVQKGAAKDSEITTSELNRATHEAERLVNSAKNFAVEMEKAAAEAIPAVTEELAALEADLVAGKDTLSSLKVDIKAATMLAESLKATLSQDTTATHTQVINTVNTGGNGGPGFNVGGAIPGYGGGDTVPIMTEGGEHVIRKEAVRKLGRPAAQAFNRGDIAGLINSLPVQKFQEGGEVQGQGATANVNLIMGEKSFPVTATQNVADEFIAEIKSINTVRGRKKNVY